MNRYAYDWPDDIPVDVSRLRGISRRQRRSPEPGKTTMPTYDAWLRFYGAIEVARLREPEPCHWDDIPF